VTPASIIHPSLSAYVGMETAHCAYSRSVKKRLKCTGLPVMMPSHDFSETFGMTFLLSHFSRPDYSLQRFTRKKKRQLAITVVHSRFSPVITFIFQFHSWLIFFSLPHSFVLLLSFPSFSQSFQCLPVSESTWMTLFNYSGAHVNRLLHSHCMCEQHNKSFLTSVVWKTSWQCSVNLFISTLFGDFISFYEATKK